MSIRRPQKVEIFEEVKLPNFPKCIYIFIHKDFNRLSIVLLLQVEICNFDVTVKTCKFSYSNKKPPEFFRSGPIWANSD